MRPVTPKKAICNKIADLIDDGFSLLQATTALRLSKSWTRDNLPDKLHRELVALSACNNGSFTHLGTATELAEYFRWRYDEQPQMPWEREAENLVKHLEHESYHSRSETEPYSVKQIKRRIAKKPPPPPPPPHIPLPHIIVIDYRRPHVVLHWKRYYSDSPHFVDVIYQNEHPRLYHALVPFNPGFSFNWENKTYIVYREIINGPNSRSVFTM